MILERKANGANVIRHEELIEIVLLIQLRVAFLLDTLRRSHRTSVVADLRDQVHIDGERCIARVSYVDDCMELADSYSGERSQDVRAVAVDVSDSMNEYSSEITGRSISSSWMMRYEFP